MQLDEFNKILSLSNPKDEWCCYLQKKVINPGHYESFIECHGVLDNSKKFLNIHKQKEVFLLDCNEEIIYRKTEEHVIWSLDLEKGYENIIAIYNTSSINKKNIGEIYTMKVYENKNEKYNTNRVSPKFLYNNDIKAMELVNERKWLLTHIEFKKNVCNNNQVSLHSYTYFFTDIGDEKKYKIEDRNLGYELYIPSLFQKQLSSPGDILYYMLFKRKYEEVINNTISLLKENSYSDPLRDLLLK
jgi:hypothetical protein